jgi:hypothetical protein
MRAMRELRPGLLTEINDIPRRRDVQKWTVVDMKNDWKRIFRFEN